MPVAHLHTAVIVMFGKDPDFISMTAYMFPCVPLLLRPVICLCSAGNSNNKPDIRVGISEFQHLEGSKRVESACSAAEKYPVIVFICLIKG